MRPRADKLAATLLCGLLTLAACSEVFGQGPRGGRPHGGGPEGGFPPPGPPPGGRPRHGDELGPPPPPRGAQPPPLGPRADFLSSEMRFGDRLVKGAPYSAQFVTESTQTLGDGTRITRKSTGAVYRSTEGRTRRELTLSAIGPVAIEGEPSQVVFINDPVAGAHYALDVSNHTARKVPLGAPPPAPPPPGGPEGAEDAVKTETLGKRTIEGLEAEGTRSTITIPAGRIGNDRPIQIVDERWYSPELQVVVLSSHRDPFAGENVYRLTNISREEPAATLFEVPPDYSVVEGPPPPKPARRPRQ